MAFWVINGKGTGLVPSPKITSASTVTVPPATTETLPKVAVNVPLPLSSTLPPLS